MAGRVLASVVFAMFVTVLASGPAHAAGEKKEPLRRQRLAR